MKTSALHTEDGTPRDDLDILLGEARARELVRVFDTTPVMTTAEFEKIFEGRVEQCRRVLIAKNQDYSRGKDKLHNFRSAAATYKTTPEQALMGMAIKHFQSLNDLCNDLGEGIHHSQAVWAEKLGDSLNYLFLLHALIEERYKK